MRPCLVHPLPHGHPRCEQRRTVVRAPSIQLSDTRVGFLGGLSSAVPNDFSQVMHRHAEGSARCTLLFVQSYR